MFRPPRIGPPSGNMFNVTIHRSQYILPNSTNVYFYSNGNNRHFSYRVGPAPRSYAVFDLGPLPPWLVNLPEKKGTWYHIPSLMISRNMDIWLYKKNGIKIPSQLGYIQRIRDNGFLLAVELTNLFPWDLNDPDEELNIRFYSNAFFESNRFINGGYNTHLGIDYISGYYPSEVSEGSILTWLQPRLGLQSQGMGGVYGFTNGKLIWTINSPSSLPLNSYIELIFDRSIFATAKINISSMPGFESTLDNKNKRIAVPWLYKKENNILFYDDVDFYIGKGDRAVYYHRNKEDSVRQLTNETYTLTEQYMDAYKFDHPWLDPDDSTYSTEPYILMRFRHSGWDRDVIYEHMHLKDFVKLGKEDFIEALTGSQSNIPEWRAEYIEESTYNAIQNALSTNDFDWSDAFDAYGYNAVNKYISPTDVTGLNNGYVADGLIYHQIPPGFKDATMLAFDRLGNFLGCRGGNGSGVISYPVTIGDNDTRFQHGKIIAGKLENTAVRSSFYGELEVGNGNLIAEQGFRCYVCNLVGGIPDEDWRVVEESEGYWTVSPDGMTIQWDSVSLANASAYPAVRFNTSVIYNPSVPFTNLEDGVLQFSINNICRKDGTTGPMVEYIPYASLLVFVEDKLLVENIDYFVEWPLVVVTRKYSEKNVRLVMYGLPNDDLVYNSQREYGWSYKGVLSADEKWHFRDDRNTIISYGGNVIHPSLIKAYENYWEVSGFNIPGLHASVVPYQPSDVVPYSVVDVIQCLEPIYPNKDTVKEYGKSLDIDTRMEDYMTEHMDFIVPEDPNVTSSFWKLYSPFISRIIGEMLDGRFNNLPPMNEMPTSEVQHLVEDFIWLLDYDPILRDVDLSNCTVLPHCYDDPVGLELNQYMFIKRLVTMYLNDKINLSPMLVVEE